MTRWLYKLRFLLRPFRSLGRAQRDIEDEFSFHVEMETEKNIRLGMDPREARRRALVEFGGVERYKEEVREVSGIGTVERIATDARFGLRGLRRNPVFALVAIVTLALGIGGSTAVFSVVDGILLRSLPFEEPDRLVAVWADYTRRGGPAQEWLGYPNYRDVQRLDHVFEDVAIWNDFPSTMTGRGDAETVTQSPVSYGYFTNVLRVEPTIGRGFTPDDDRPGAARVALLSHDFWVSRFGQDPGIVGSTITLNDEPYTVIGVMPRSFRQPFLETTDVWTPYGWDDTNHFGGRGSAILRAIGRLQAGVTLETARAEADALGSRLEAEYPEFNTGVGYTLLPLHDNLVQQASTALWVLLGAVGAVLLLVCVNLANLLLARATARQAEIAVRAALGAGRRRLVGQLLTESVVLAIVGGALGVAVALVATDLLVQLAPAGTPRLSEVAVDGRVLLVAAAATLSAGVLFGLVPSLRASRTDLRDSLSEGGRGLGAGAPGRRLRSALVAGQVALALVLLVAAGLLLRSFQELRGLDLGFDPENVVTFQLFLPDTRYPEVEAVRAYQAELESRIQEVPGVVAVGAINSLPLGGNDGDTDFNVEGRPVPQPGEENVAWIRRVTPGYFEAIGLQVPAGRTFDDRDRQDGVPVVIVNETLAARYFGDDGAIGKRVNVNNPEEPVWREIVGVARDVKNFGLRGEGRNAMYVPSEQLASHFMTVVVRASGDPAALIPSLRAEVSSTDPTLPLTMTTMQSVVSRALDPDRFVTTLLALFAGLALVLAAVGLYGVVAYNVTRRMREMGVRVALGAAGAEIGRLVVGQSLLLAGAGVAVGLVGAYAVTGLMTGLLFGVSPTDPATFAAVAALLGLVALAASALPAIKAARVDPVEVLKTE